MDKRFILMFFIIIIGIFNLFIITEYSDVIGTASVDVSNYTFSLPRDFIVLNNNDPNGVSIYNTHTGLHIVVNVIPTYDSTFKFYQLENDSNYEVLSNGTINIGNVSIDSIYYNYENQTNKSGGVIFYFNKNNDSFKILMDNFDYETQRNETIESLSYIVNSIRANYK